MHPIMSALANLLIDDVDIQYHLVSILEVTDLQIFPFFSIFRLTLMVIIAICRYRTACDKNHYRVSVRVIWVYIRDAVSRMDVADSRQFSDVE